MTEKAASPVLSGQSVWPNDRIKDIAVELLVARAAGRYTRADDILDPLGRIDLRLLITGLADAYLTQFVSSRRDNTDSPGSP